MQNIPFSLSWNYYWGNYHSQSSSEPMTEFWASWFDRTEEAWLVIRISKADWEILYTLPIHQIPVCIPAQECLHLGTREEHTECPYLVGPENGFLGITLRWYGAKHAGIFLPILQPRFVELTPWGIFAIYTWPLWGDYGF